MEKFIIWFAKCLNWLKDSDLVKTYYMSKIIPTFWQLMKVGRKFVRQYQGVGRDWKRSSFCIPKEELPGEGWWNEAWTAWVQQTSQAGERLQKEKITFSSRISSSSSTNSTLNILWHLCVGGKQLPLTLFNSWLHKPNKQNSCTILEEIKPQFSFKRLSYFFQISIRSKFGDLEDIN